VGPDATTATAPTDARTVRAYLRSHRSGFYRPSAYQVYVTVLCVAVGGTLGAHAIAQAVSPGLDQHELLVGGPVLASLTLFAALRFGTWQGPVGFSAADVAFVLTAPIALADLIRPRLGLMLLLGAVVGLLIGGGVLALLAAGPAAIGALRCVCGLVAFAAFGLLAVAGSWLVQSSRTFTARLLRASPLVILFAAALLAAGLSGVAGREIAAWSGPWGWVIAPFAGIGGWPLALALLVITALAGVWFSFRRAGAGTIEQYLTRAESRAGLSASITLLDYRSAAQTYGATQAWRTRRQLRVPRPRRRGLTILWRDAVGLTRSPARLGWSALLAAGATWEALTHPGKVVPALIAAVALYFAAAILCEPLRLDIDQPDKSRLLIGWPFRRVFLSHLVLPAVWLIVACTVTIVLASVTGYAGIGALALIPTLMLTVIAVSVLSAALAARRGGRVPDSVLTMILSTDMNNPIALSVILFIAPWLLLNVIVLVIPLLLLGHAAAHHLPTGGPASLAFSLTLFVAVALLAVARRSAGDT
jgi:Family of unknown function (DUF6297)